MSDSDQRDRFERLLEDNAPRLLRIARSYARGHEAEDLLQDIHLQLWRSLGSFAGKAHIDTWLYRVALNTAFSHYRKRRRRPEGDQPPDELPAPSNPGDSMHLLEEFLTGLNPVNRSTLLMYLEGLSHAEIAEVLGSNANAVGVRINRLKRAFEQRYVEDAA